MKPIFFFDSYYHFTFGNHKDFYYVSYYIQGNYLIRFYNTSHITIAYPLTKDPAYFYNILTQEDEIYVRR